MKYLQGGLISFLILQNESQGEVQNDNNQHTQDDPPANEGINEAVQPTGELEQQQ